MIKMSWILYTAERVVSDEGDKIVAHINVPGVTISNHKQALIGVLLYLLSIQSIHFQMPLKCIRLIYEYADHLL